MARIAKSGLEYFPFDIDFFQDIRIRKLIKRQGGKAVTVYALLLCLIYKDGYYMQWDEELPFIVSENTGFDEAYISEVIKTCLTLGLFNKNLFDDEKVLTSKGIQVRYCNIQRLNKRMSRIDKYSLLDEQQKPASPAKVTKPANRKKPVTPKTQPPVTPQPEPTPPAATRPAAATSGDNNAEWLSEFFANNHSENLQLLCMNFGLKPKDIKKLRSLADEVVTEWKLSRTKHQDYSDWSRHLISAMRIKSKGDSQRSKRTGNSNNNPEPQSSDYTFNGGFGGMDV